MVSETKYKKVHFYVPIVSLNTEMVNDH